MSPIRIPGRAVARDRISKKAQQLDQGARKFVRDEASPLKHAVDLIGPTAVVLDNLASDIRHAIFQGFRQLTHISLTSRRYENATPRALGSHGRACTLHGRFAGSRKGRLQR